MALGKVIRHWRVKGLIQGLLSAVPGGDRINDHLQTVLGDLRYFENNIKRKVDDWAGIMSHLDAVHHRAVEDSPILEIGTGWYPSLPFCFVLAGFPRVYTVDLTRHMRKTLTFRMLRALMLLTT